MPCCIHAFDLDKKGKHWLELCESILEDFWSFCGFTSTSFALASGQKMECRHSLGETFLIEIKWGILHTALSALNGENIEPDGVRYTTLKCNELFGEWKLIRSLASILTLIDTSMTFVLISRKSCLRCPKLHANMVNWDCSNLSYHRVLWCFWYKHSLVSHW